MIFQHDCADEEPEEEVREDPIRKFSAATSLEKPTLRDPLGEFQIIEKQNSCQNLGRLRRYSTMEKPEHLQVQHGS